VISLELVRRPREVVEIAPEKLLEEARASSRRLHMALTLILSLNLAVVSGAVTFWALAFRN
jgi:hypothetical protein